MAKPKEYQCEVWHLEFKDASSNSNKFYQVLVSETGVCVLRWGRAGSTGQSSVNRYGSLEDARDQGLKQVFAKKAKGYLQPGNGTITFMATTTSLDYAQNGNVVPIFTEYAEAKAAGQFAGAKATVLKHYADFAEQCQTVMNQAASGELGETLESYEELSRVWDEISDKHAEVSTIMQLAQATVAQKLMGV